MHKSDCIFGMGVEYLDIWGRVIGLVLVHRSGNPAAGSGHSRIISDVQDEGNSEKEGHKKLKWNAATGFKITLSVNINV